MTQSDSQWGLAINNTVQVGQKMSCTIVVNRTSEYAVSIIGFEPLLTALVGTRTFNVTVNGQTINGVDYTRYAGVRTLYEVGFRSVASSVLTINFESVNRTAVWSMIKIQELAIEVILPVSPAAQLKLPLGIIQGGKISFLQQPYKDSDLPKSPLQNAMILSWYK